MAASIAQSSDAEDFVETGSALANAKERIAALEAELHQQRQLAADFKRNAMQSAHNDALALLDTIYATAPVGLAFLDTDLRYVRVNQMLAEIDGLPVEAYLDRSVDEVLPDLAPTLEPLLRQVLATGEAIRDIPIRGTTAAAPDAPRDWLAGYYPVYGHDGSIAGVGAVIVDITERIQAEVAVRERDTWLHIAYEATDLGTWRHDLVAGQVSFNFRAQRHYGFAEAVVPLEAVLTRVHPDDRARLQQEIAATTDPASDGRYATEYRVVHTDGSIHWLAIQARVFFSPDVERRPLSGVGTSQDITARKQMEQDLRAGEARFRMLAEHAQDLLYRYRLSPDPGFEYVSPSATAITGYTPEEHYADPQLGFKLVHPDDRMLLEQSGRDPNAAGRAITLRWQRKDGSLIWTEQINQVITDSTGRPIAIEGIARDITARKQAEEQVQTALAAEQHARRASEHAAERAARLQQVTAALSAAVTQEAVVAVITEQSMIATGAGAVAISRLDAAGDYLDSIGAKGCDPAMLHAFQQRVVNSPQPAATTVHTGEPICLSSHDEAAIHFPGSDTIMAQMVDHAHATAPLITAGQIIGAISWGFSEPQPFALEDRNFLATLAQQCAYALDRARLYDEVLDARMRLQKLSQRLLELQEQERRHIARELHDEIGQVLGALKINLHVLGLQPVSDPVTNRLQESLSMIDRLIQQVRALSLDLRPSVLDDLGLVAALTWYCERLQQRSGLDVRFSDQLDGKRLPPLLATVCFRITQEALTNVVRHAVARQVTVYVGREAGSVLLRISDDGCGFDVGEQLDRATAGSSLGLISMLERAELAGGRTEIRSTPGHGTEIELQLPVETH